ncbi:Putative Ig domain family [Verrucomicrobiia bacterium DG1235]|nr:Putative Ig domain family [Verrucomicrobiae bacterium DG1235]
MESYAPTPARRGNRTLRAATLAAHRLAARLANPRTQLATLTLVAVLQKAPALVRVFNGLKFSVEPATRLLQKTAIAAASLGSYHALSGATTAVYVTDPDAPLTLDTGEQVTFTFGVQQTNTAPLSWTVSGQLPPGLTVSGTQGAQLSSEGFFNDTFGQITGAPTEAGSFTVFLQPWKFTGGTGNTAEAFELNITVNAVSTNSPPEIATAIPDQTAVAGIAYNYDYSQHFTDPDGDETLSFSISLSDESDLPAWLTNSDGALSGTPAESDISTITLKATASDGEFTAEDTFDLSIEAPPELIAPVASIEDSSDALVVSWSIQTGQSYEIQTADNPLDESDWTSFPATVETNGSQQSATLPKASLPATLLVRVATSFATP